MKILNLNKQTIVLTFIDQQQLPRQLPKQVFVPETIKDDASLDFNQMLQRQWNVQPDEIIFNSKNRMEVERSRRIIRTAANFQREAENGGLVVTRDRGKHVKDKIRLPEIQANFCCLREGWDVDQFLGSSWFQICTRFFVLLYVTGLLLTDYSFRLTKNNTHEQHPPSPQISTPNLLSLHFQLASNCAFTLQTLLKMFSKSKFFQNPWNITLFIGCIACWICISLDFQLYDGNGLYHVLCVMRIMLAVRIIQIFQFVKKPFENFLMTLPALSKIFFPYLVFIVMYSVLGLILFIDATQHKCRQTPTPVNNTWPQILPNLCGSGSFQCKTGYCGNPYDYNLPYNMTQKYEIGNQFGLVNFENIGSSFLVVYHYVFLSNWTGIMSKFSKFLNPYVTTFYFFTLALFLFFIMSNLNMITMCKTFIQKQKQKQQLHPQPPTPSPTPPPELSPTLSTLLSILKYLDLFLIILSAVVILIEYEGMTSGVRTVLNRIDFGVTICCVGVVLAKGLGLGGRLWEDRLVWVDFVGLGVCVGDFVYCGVVGEDVVDPASLTSRVLRSIKLLRILRIIYFSQSWFTFQKTILKIFIQTLNTVKPLLALLLYTTLILSMIGSNLFAHLVKTNHTTHKPDLQHGSSYFTNFDSVYKALVAVIMLLENQRWTETMYNFYGVVGWEAVAYFTVVVFVIHLLITRLFLAIFLCYFRRNLEKQDQLQEKQIKTKNKHHDKHQSNQNFPVPQFLNPTQPNPNPSQLSHQPSQPQSNQLPHQLSHQVPQQPSPTPTTPSPQPLLLPTTEQKIFFLLNRNACIPQLLRACYNSLLFHRLVMAMIAIHCLTIVLRTNQDGQEKTDTLNVIERVPLYFYVGEVMVGVFGFGLYWGTGAYLKQSRIHYVNVVVVLLVVVSQLKFLGQFQTSMIRRFTILKILTFFTRTNKQTSIVLDSISSISQKFIRMIVIYMFLLILSCLLPLKLAGDSLSSCQNYITVVDHSGTGSGSGTGSVPHGYRECMLMGGDWVKDAQQFGNVFQAVVLMYQIVTAESWAYFVERFQQTSTYWDIFFVLNFFIYNLCLLNIFIGLNVETYLTLKDQAYKLNLLQPNQRMWLLIKNTINQLIPTPSLTPPKTTSPLRHLCYSIISQPLYQNFIDILPYINIFFYCLRYYRASPEYLEWLDIVNWVIVVVFMADTGMKLGLGLGFGVFYLENFRVQLLGFFYHCGWIVGGWVGGLGHQAERVLRFIGALLLILRGKKLLFRFTWSKTLLNSVIEVLPKCVIIGALLAVILFFYISIGMQIFKHTKPTPKSDGYLTGFNNAFTSLMTLLKIVSNESWFQQVSAFVRDSSPIDICFHADTNQEVRMHPGMACGSRAGYIYFISFHMIIALLVMNLLIATMVAAYDENYQKEYKSVNIFQLQDCLKLWQKYDCEGTGVIPYKQFWRLSSEIAIIFGISKKKLIKGKQKFLQQLGIEVFQSTDPNSSKILCYKFHDVLTKLSKIKLTVSKSDSDENHDLMDFQVHPMIQQQIKDYVIKPPPIYQHIKPFKNLKSGQMKYFFALLRKMRAWKIVAKRKESSVISKLSHIVNMALQRKKKEEKEIAHIRSSMSNYLGSAK